MLDLSQFAKIATIEMHDPVVAVMNELPPPHKYAREVLERFAGVQLVPTNPYNPDVRFGVDEAVGYQNEILKLGAIFGEELYPIGEVNNEHGILLMSATGEVYSISVNSLDVYYLGTLENAIETHLRGHRLRPVLPRRDYPQRHNFDIYHPTSTGVMWVDAQDWIKPTKVSG